MDGIQIVGAKKHGANKMKKIIPVIAVFLLLIAIAISCSAGAHKPFKGKDDPKWIMNVQNQCYWETIYDGNLSNGVDTTLAIIDLTDANGSPQFFAYTVDIDTLGGQGGDDVSDSCQIYIDYKTKIDPDDATWYSQRYGKYYIIHTDSVITADSAFTDQLTLYGCNYIQITIHNKIKGTGSSTDASHIKLVWWMKH